MRCENIDVERLLREWHELQVDVGTVVVPDWTQEECRAIALAARRRLRAIRAETGGYDE